MFDQRTGKRDHRPGDGAVGVSAHRGVSAGGRSRPCRSPEADPHRSDHGEGFFHAILMTPADQACYRNTTPTWR